VSELRVRIYDVKFGDAILLTVPGVRATSKPKHVLIDVGNAPFSEGDGNDKSVYLPIVLDVLDELAGEPLHLYISTHEHMDHVQGLFHASRDLSQEEPPRVLKDLLAIERVWLTGSADPDYYDTHPEAKKQLAFRQQFFKGLAEAAAAAGRPILPARFDAMAANNNPASTAACVAYARTMGSDPDSPRYLHREIDLSDAHELTGVSIRVLAPEEDTSEYYGKAHALWADDTVAQGRLDLLKNPDGGKMPAAPAGVDATAFRKLWKVLRDGPLTDTLLQIDKAANNTSIVFELTWKRWKLLFAGDAEERSWATMSAVPDLLQPVHFLKVSHHGSHNGTPSEELLERILPKDYDGPERIAVVSTCSNTYSGIPHTQTDAAIRERCPVFLKTTDRDLQTAPSGARYFDLTFDSAGPG
jgi:hypothetical protein